MPTIEVSADVFFEYRGLKIYHVYKDDDMDQGILRDYNYSFSEYAREVDDDGGFFVDELPQWKANAAPSYRKVNQFYDAVKKTIREAVDNCDLDREIEAGGQDFPNRYLNYYRHEDCTPEVIKRNGGEIPEWSDPSPFTNNDKCECGAEIEPWKSEDIPVSDTPTKKADRQIEITLTPPEFDTILAALRFWQGREEFVSAGRIEAVMEIATNAGEHPALTFDEIDALCERIN